MARTNTVSNPVVAFINCYCYCFIKTWVKKEFSIWLIKINLHTFPFSSLYPKGAHFSLSFKVLHIRKKRWGRTGRKKRRDPKLWQAQQWHGQSPRDGFWHHLWTSADSLPDLSRSPHSTVNRNARLKTTNDMILLFFRSHLVFSPEIIDKQYRELWRSKIR